MMCKNIARNEKGQFMKSSETLAEQIENLKKTLAELEAKQAEETSSKEETPPKTSEKDVWTAFEEYSKARNEYTRLRNNLEENVKKEMTQIHEKYRNALDAIEATREDARKKAQEELSKYFEDHPGEDFYYTYKSPDGCTTYQYVCRADLSFL